MLIILLMLVYGVSSSGMTLHIHYCCGEIDRIDVAPVEKDNCDKGHNKPMKNCCDEKQLPFKIKSDQKAEAGVKLFCKIFLPEKIHYNNEPAIRSGYKCTTGFTDSSPPSAAATPVYILHCIYRI